MRWASSSRRSLRTLATTWLCGRDGLFGRVATGFDVMVEVEDKEEDDVERIVGMPLVVRVFFAVVRGVDMV